jgi:hypothetical protein
MQISKNSHLREHNTSTLALQRQPDADLQELTPEGAQHINVSHLREHKTSPSVGLFMCS